MYKFQKVKNPNGYREFSHQFFRKGCKAGLVNIKRRTSKNAKVSRSNAKRRHPTAEGSVKVNERLDKLEKTIKMLNVQTQSLLKANGKMLKRLGQNKAGTDLKIKKLMLVLHRATRYQRANGGQLSLLMEKIRDQVERLQKESDEEHVESIVEMVEPGSKLNPARDELFNQAINCFYDELSQPVMAAPYKLMKIKEEAEENFLKQITANETPGRLFCIDEVISVSNNNFTTDREATSCGGLTPHLFGYSDMGKSEPGFTPLRFDAKSRYSPHLLKPYSIDMNSFGKRILK